MGETLRGSMARRGAPRGDIVEEDEDRDDDPKGDSGDEDGIIIHGCVAHIYVSLGVLPKGYCCSKEGI